MKLINNKHLQTIYESAIDLKKQAFLLLLFFVCSMVLQAQDPPQYGTPFEDVPDPRDINMYQVNTRAFSTAGNFQGVIDRLDNIKDLGINVIYLMPIYPVGTDPRSSQPNGSTSPYSIKDFKSVGAEFGNLNDLRRLVDGAHERGIAVMLDFVVNQTSWDHPWIEQNPNWYIQDENGEIQPPNQFFPDVAGLELSNQNMRAAIIDAMRYWIFAANIDGYRMDFANNPPLEYWQQINTNLRGITSHDLLLLAEGDRPENFNVGFDLNFGDKWYYDAIKRINNNNESAANNIETTTNREYEFADETQQVVRFLENHDVNSFVGPAIETSGGTDAAFANFVVSAYMRGVPFLYSGQEVGSDTVIPFPWDAVNINWNQNPQITAEFKRILDFRLENEAIRRGTLFTFSNNDVVGFTKISGSEEVLVVTNLRANSASITIPAAIANASWKDAYTGNSATVGANVTLNRYEYRVYVKGDGTTNQAPTANAGNDQELPTNTTTTTLSGSGTDPDGNPLFYRWTQVSGPASIITNEDSANTEVNGLTNGSTYVYELTVSDGSASDTDTVQIRIGQSNSTQSPYGGSARTIPGIVEAEDYDNGGSGVAYNDDDASNNGGEYRPSEGVDIEAASEGGFNIGWTNAGEWTEYTVDVADSGTYIAEARIASEIGGDFRLEFKGMDKTGGINAPNTGGWQSYQTVTSQEFTLEAGVQIMRVFFINGGFNLNNITIKSSTTTGPQTDVYRIKNRWKNTYLYDNGDQLAYGDVTDERAQWELETREGFTLFKNKETGDYINIEGRRNFVEATAVDASFWSAQWMLEDFDGYKRIRNRWQSNEYIDIERELGFAQSTAGLFNGSYSTHWTLEPVGPKDLSVNQPSLSEISLKAIKIFPVPAEDVLNIVVPAGVSDIQVKVHDLSGRKLMQSTVDSGTHEIPVETLTGGIYMMNISDGTTQVSKTFIKK